MFNTTPTQPNPDIFDNHYQKGVAALRAHNYKTAQVHLIDAADVMQRLAAASPDATIRQYREEATKELLDLVRLCSQASERSSKGGTSATKAPDAAKAQDGEKGLDPQSLLVKDISVTLADIIGHEYAKDQLRETMLYPFQYPELYQQFRVDAGGGLLLFGPPGTGKTELAAAAANEIKADFFSVSASDIMSKWVGEAEKNVKQLFTEARRSKRAVIFLDDCQQLMSSEDSGNSRVTKAVLGEFLTGLEGIVSRTNREKTTILFIAATNEPWVIAPGMLSRFGGRIIHMGLPSAEERKRIFQAKLTDVPLSDDVDLTALAARTERYSGREILNICRRTKIQAIKAIAESGTHSPITQDMFLDQIERVKPATTPEALCRFDEWCAKHGTVSTK